MKKRKTLLIAILCLHWLAQVYAQELQPCALGNIQWGQPINEPPNYHPIRLIGVDQLSGSSFWESGKADNILIERFDANNNREFSVVVSPLDLEGCGGFQQVMFCGMLKLKNAIAFFPISTRPGKQGSLFACTLGLDGSLLIDTQWICDGVSAFNFQTALSHDSTHFVLAGVETDINGVQKISVRMYDEELHLTFSQYILPKDNDVPSATYVDKVIVDKDDVIHIASDIDGLHYVFSVDPTTGNLSEFNSTRSRDYFNLACTSGGEALIYGLGHADSIRNANQFLGLWNSVTHQFDFSRFGLAPMRKTSYRNFVALTYIPRKDGGQFLISEEESGSISRLQEGDIDVLNLSENENAIYQVTIPKKQVSHFLSRLNQLSYMHYYLEQKKVLALLYTMKPKSVPGLDMTGVDPMVLRQKTIPIVSLIDDSGKITTLPLFKDVNDITIYNLDVGVGNNEFIIGRKNKQYAIGRLSTR